MSHKIHHNTVSKQFGALARKFHFQRRQKLVSGPQFLDTDHYSLEMEIAACPFSPRSQTQYDASNENRQEHSGRNITYSSGLPAQGTTGKHNRRKLGSIFWKNRATDSAPADGAGSVEVDCSAPDLVSGEHDEALGSCTNTFNNTATSAVSPDAWQNVQSIPEQTVETVDGENRQELVRLNNDDDEGSHNTTSAATSHLSDDVKSSTVSNPDKLQPHSSDASYLEQLPLAVESNSSTRYADTCPAHSLSVDIEEVASALQVDRTLSQDQIFDEIYLDSSSLSAKATANPRSRQAEEVSELCSFPKYTKNGGTKSDNYNTSQERIISEAQEFIQRSLRRKPVDFAHAENEDSPEFTAVSENRRIDSSQQSAWGYLASFFKGLSFTTSTEDQIAEARSFRLQRTRSLRASYYEDTDYDDWSKYEHRSYIWDEPYGGYSTVHSRYWRGTPHV